jgi:putative hydrolase of HD superfamily
MAKGKKIENFEDSVITLFFDIHPLDQVQRAGYVLRGIASPESVSAHSHFLSLLTLLYVEQFPGMFNKEKALAMAIAHDLPEAILMDVPLPASETYLKEAKKNAELNIFNDLFKNLPHYLPDIFKEYVACETPEARLVSALDKAQMMIKILCYQNENRGRLAEFWSNSRNFRDYGLKPVSLLFDAICRHAGVKRPRD